MSRNLTARTGPERVTEALDELERMRVKLAESLRDMLGRLGEGVPPTSIGEPHDSEKMPSKLTASQEVQVIVSRINKLTGDMHGDLGVFEALASEVDRVLLGVGIGAVPVKPDSRKGLYGDECPAESPTRTISAR